MFQEGRGVVEDFERLGRPVTVKTGENMGKVRTYVRTDRRLGIRIITDG
jgi:hypothetical protein